jgi:peptidoglycan-N-acetylglucosamine deacetylase
LEERNPLPQEQTQVSCVIPAARVDLLDTVVQSVADQTVQLADIVVVLDGPNLVWKSKLANIKVVQSPENEGKVSATLRGCSAATGSLILSVDDDTILPPECLEHLLLHLQDEIEVVCARIEPMDVRGWIGRARDDLYRKSHTRPGLINGACFLTSKRLLEEYYPTFTTLVEDQELTRKLSKPYRHWMVCQEARVKTREPGSPRQLFHQMVRWSYGTRQLDAKRMGHGYRISMALFVLNPFLVVMLLLPIGTLVLTYRYHSSGASTLRLALYSLVETMAAEVATIRYVLYRKPSW